MREVDLRTGRYVANERYEASIVLLVDENAGFECPVGTVLYDKSSGKYRFRNVRDVWEGENVWSLDTFDSWTEAAEFLFNSMQTTATLEIDLDEV